MEHFILNTFISKNLLLFLSPIILIKAASFNGNSQEKNFVILKYHFMFDTISQAQVDLVTFNLSKARDFHNGQQGNWVWRPTVVLSNIVASAINASLVTEEWLDDKQSSERKIDFPTILPELPLYDKYELTVEYNWQKFHEKHHLDPHSTKEDPVFIQISQMDCSFVYCNVPRSKRESIWKFSLFTRILDKWTWLVGVISGVFVTLLISIQNKVSFLTAILPIISSVISPGVAGQSIIKKSWTTTSLLFTLWMFSTLTIVNLYSGDMTSTLIRPDPDDTIKSMEELVERNYSLIFAHGKLLDRIVSKLYSHYFEWNGEPRIDAYLSSRTKALRHLIDKAMQDRTSSITGSARLGNYEHLMTALVARDKVATFWEWPFVLWIANVALIGRKTDKQCHVGTKFMKAGPTFFAFLPPNADQLSQVFQRIIESGIYEMWSNQKIALAYPKRVGVGFMQVFGKTKVLTEVDVEAIKLTMEGKVITIFLLWSIGLLVSGGYLALELLHTIVIKFNAKRHKQQYILKAVH